MNRSGAHGAQPFFSAVRRPPPLAIGEVVYTATFLAQAPGCLRNVCWRADAAKLPDRLARGAADR